MKVDREVNQGGRDEALHRLTFVLDKIEELDKSSSLFFVEKWGDRLTHEEIIGALVAAEQVLKEDEGGE